MHEKHLFKCGFCLVAILADIKFSLWLINENMGLYEPSAQVTFQQFYQTKANPKNNYNQSQSRSSVFEKSGLGENSG